jgi:endonuclease YncB( thermonuclease family)
MAATVAAQAHADAGRCQPTGTETAVIAAVLDARTVRLADGREVRLLGLEVPDDLEKAQAAKAALTALVEHRAIKLGRLGDKADRYGRVLALVSPEGSETSAQRSLIAQGHSRVAARVGGRACALPLLEAERSARASGLGLWTDPKYVIRQAGNPHDVLAERGSFAVVEGDVLSVRESGGTIYMNFGRRWSDDFTVTISKRNERAFAEAGLALKGLANRRVRVRGFVEERGGPWIEAARPEQIEVVERD